MEDLISTIVANNSAWIRRVHFVTNPLTKIEISGQSVPNRLDVTMYVTNANDIGLTLKRNDLSGVFIEYSTAFIFCMEAADLIRSIWEKDELRSNLYVHISRRNDITNDYIEEKTMRFDFTTYMDDTQTIEIESMQDTIESLLASKGSTDFDIPVSEIERAEKLNYSRIHMDSIVRWSASTEPVSSVSHVYHTLFLHLTAAESIVDDRVNVEASTQQGVAGNLYNEYFLKATGRVDGLRLKIKMSVVVTSVLFLDAGRVFLFKRTPDGSILTLRSFGMPIIGRDGRIDIDFASEDISLDEGECLGIALAIETRGSTYSFQVENFEEFNVSWEAIGANEPEISIINPETLLQRLINDMSENDKYSGRIEGLNDITPGASLMLCAAESIRALTNAKIHTSYNDFRDWMYVYGFEPTYEGNTLIFRRRDALFKDEVVIALSENEVANNPIISADESSVYSVITTGYKKKDYKETNGKLEFNGTHSYSTGLDNVIYNNNLELISPYRADCFGFELLCQEQYKDSTDTDSDTDVFVLALKDEGSRFTIYRTGTLTGANNTWFNEILNPRAIAEWNNKLIGISTSELRFTASDANSNISVRGVKISENVQTPTSHVKSQTIKLNTGNYKGLPSELNGVVTLRHNGKTYSGYIDQIDMNTGHREEEEWTLIERGR